MVDTIHTSEQIEDFFYLLSLLILGLDPLVPYNQSRVRIAWPTKGAPTWKITDNVAFLLLNIDDDPVNKQMETTYTELDSNTADSQMSYTRVLRMSWICYGPSSFNDADLLRSQLFTFKITQLLAANNLALITDVPAPISSPELFAGQWWARTSFYARFNELVIRHSDVPYLNSADIQIKEG